MNPREGRSDAGQAMATAKTNFCMSAKYGSPLVLDLNNNGEIELTDLYDDPEKYFDIDEDGFAEQIAWVQPDDGLLVRDLNDNGQIDNVSELFGSVVEDGFTQLRMLDANYDGVVDQSDPDFATLLIWRDENSDAISTPEELQSLSVYSIIAINIKAKSVNMSNAGNRVSHIGTFVVNKNGLAEKRAVHDIWFRYDNMNVRRIGEITLDKRVSSLPNLRGYGIIPDLKVAMSLNFDQPESLGKRVLQIKQMTFQQVFQKDNQIIDLLRETLFIWADLNSWIPDSRGPFIDARELVFLEMLVDQAYMQRGIHSSPYIRAGDALGRVFDYVLEHYSARIISQLVGEELFRFGRGYTLVPDLKPELISAYNIRTDEFEGIIGLRPLGLKAIEAIAAATDDPDYAWNIALRMIEFSVGLENLPAGDLALLSQSLLASGASSLATHSMAIQAVSNSLLDPSERRRAKRTTDDDNDGHLVGTPEKDFLVGDHDDEILQAGDGADEIRGNGGNDRLIGEGGSDYLLGGPGDDVYVFGLGSGIDVINEGNDNRGHDVLELGAGITLEDLVSSDGATRIY